MSVELQALETAVATFERQADDDFVDLRRLSAVIDRLQAKQCRVAAAAKKRGEHQLSGHSPSGWVAKQCLLSKSAAADRLCVGEAEAAKTWHAVDPAGFDLKGEEAHERRQLFISECGDMYRIDGWLELSAGAAVKTAIESLSAPLAADDNRRPKQRRADALTELAHHALDQGTLPARNGARPHVAVHTTIEGLKGELGSRASELADGTPISSKTVQRLACDGVLHRVLKADSMVVDVGRAKRTAQPAQWRALKARHRTCAWPGCDRPASWTQAHHIELWKDGGRTDLRKMIPLCYYHHRLVHEGGWQVIRAADRLEFIPPDRPVMIRRRWGERRWAA